MTDPIEPSEPDEDPPNPGEPLPESLPGDAPTAGIPAPDTTGTRAAAATPVPAASGSPAVRPVPALMGRRQFARTSPVVIDRGRASFGLPSFGDRRQAGQIGLVVLMVLALGAILLARSGQTGSPGDAGPSASPHASVRPTPTASAHASPSVSVTPVPTSSSSTGGPGPSPSTQPRTYRVQSGDTLSSIAARFNTTAKALEALNDLKSPFVIRPGQVLKLP